MGLPSVLFRRTFPLFLGISAYSKVPSSGVVVLVFVPMVFRRGRVRCWIWGDCCKYESLVKAAVDLYVVRACVTESALPRMDWPSRFDARRAGTVH